METEAAASFSYSPNLSQASFSTAESGLYLGDTDLMDVMRLLMESDTVREWPAKMDQVGGSLGLRISERAVSNKWVELSSIERAERRIGSWAAEPCDWKEIQFSLQCYLINSFLKSHKKCVTYIKGKYQPKLCKYNIHWMNKWIKWMKFLTKCSNGWFCNSFMKQVTVLFLNEWVFLN